MHVTDLAQSYLKNTHNMRTLQKDYMKVQCEQLHTTVKISKDSTTKCFVSFAVICLPE